MQIIAILDRSTGNETVGEAWQETKIFEEQAPIIDVLSWAAYQHSYRGEAVNFRGNLKIAVAQEDSDAE